MYFCLQATHPPPVQFFPLVEQHDADLTRGWFSTGRLERLCGPACHDAGAAAGEYAVTGLLSDPAFLSRPAASTGKLRGRLPSGEGFACPKGAPGSPLFYFLWTFGFGVSPLPSSLLLFF